MNNLNKIKKSAKYIKKILNINNFDIALIFGSGLTSDKLADEQNQILYKRIPYFPASNVSGHNNKLIYKNINNKNVLFFLGRLHYYEGHSIDEVTFAIRLIKELGINTLILTNASGALNPKLKAGSLMIIKDHINLTGQNPLIGPNINEHGQRFVNMNDCYCKELNKKLQKVSKEKLFEGTYIGVTGPTYETKSEIKYYQKIGGDTVGMSTVMENIVSRHCGINTIGISCITNNLNNLTALNHNEVLDIAGKTKEKLYNLLISFINNL